MELSYKLLKGITKNIPIEQEKDLEKSTVVHQSVDLLHDKDWVAPPPPDTDANAPVPAAFSLRKGTNQDPASDPDRIITNSRPPLPSDGLASLSELQSLMSWVGEDVRSAYGEGYGKCKGEEGKWYVDRKPEVQSGSGWLIEELMEVKEKRKEGDWKERVRRGDFEPMWTNVSL